MALLMVKVPQNHRHATFTNNLYGSTKWLINSLALKQNQPLLFVSPTIIAHSAIAEKNFLFFTHLRSAHLPHPREDLIFSGGEREGVILDLFQNLSSYKPLKQIQGHMCNVFLGKKIALGELRREL